MKLKSFEHVLVLADDLEETKDFYVDVIGLTVGKRPDFKFPGYWLYLGNQPCVHLAGADRDGGGLNTTGGSAPAGSGRIDHVAFNAEDFVGAKAALDARGCEYRHRKVPGAPLQQLFVEDPNGVTVEINFPA